MTDYLDSVTVPFSLRTSGQEEGTYYTTFEDLYGWGDCGNPTAFDRSLYITRKHGTDGVTALRLDSPTTYDGLGLEAQWVDAVRGGQYNVTYWLSYSFYLEEWAGFWGNGDRTGTQALPGMGMRVGDINYGPAPFLQAQSATTGRMSNGFMFGSGYTNGITAGVWHTIKQKYVNDGVNRTGEQWYDGVSTGTSTFAASPPYDLPIGIDIFNDAGQVGRGVIYIDDMIWSPGVEPRTASAVESITIPYTNQQWVKIRDKDSGTAAEIKVDLPSDENDAHWFSGVYVPSTMLSQITNGTSTNSFLTWANCGLKISKVASINKWQLNDDTAFGTVTAGWHDIRVHHVAGATQVDIKIDGVLYQPYVNAAHTGTATAIGDLTASHVKDRTGATPGSTNWDWLGFSELAVNVSGPVLNTDVDYQFPMQNVDMLEDVTGLYGPTYTASLGPAGDVASYEEAAQAPGPMLPQLVYNEEAEVYLNISLSAIEYSNYTEGTVYVNMTVSSVEAYYVDAATVYVNLQSIATGEAFASSDAAEIYLDFVPLGGECFSTLTASLFGEGEADQRWSTTFDEVRWDGTDETRWSEGDIVVEGINC